MATLPKAIYRFNAIPIRILKALFIEIEETILKFVLNHRRTSRDKAILRKKNKAGGITFLDSKLHCKAIIIKIVCYCHKNRCIDHWSRIESPQLNPGIHSHFDEGNKTNQWGKIISSRNGVQKTGETSASNEMGPLPHTTNKN